MTLDVLEVRLSPVRNGHGFRQKEALDVEADVSLLLTLECSSACRPCNALNAGCSDDFFGGAMKAGAVYGIIPRSSAAFHRDA